jgi:mRNA interferase RelE/StbE
LEVTWKVSYKKSVEKDLKKISKDIQYIIKRAIEEKLMTDPLKFGAPLRRNLQGLMKLRVGAYRIIYSIDAKIVTVYVIKVGHRKDVYGK